MAHVSSREIDLSRPFDRTWWVEAGKLLAGCYPGLKDAERMRDQITRFFDIGITNFVNLMEVDELDNSGHPFRPYRPVAEEIGRSRGIQVSCVRFPIRDLGVPAVPEMVRVLDNIDDSAKSGRVSYVHCWGGRGRTGSVVGCWLVRHRFASGETALDRIDKLRRVVPMAYRGSSPETEEQRGMVRSWRPGQ